LTITANKFNQVGVSDARASTESFDTTKLAAFDEVVDGLPAYAKKLGRFRGRNC